MPKTAGLTVVLDWDDAKVKKGVADLNKMFQGGLGNLSVGGDGALKGLDTAAKGVQKSVGGAVPFVAQLNKEIKLLNAEAIRLSYVGKGNTEQFQRLTETLNAHKSALKDAKSEVNATAGAYAMLQKQANDATRKANDLGAALGLDSKAFKDAAATANQYTQKLKDIEAASGRNFRNVGNYASGYNAISTSISRIVGEMPNFTQSLRIGFMAISNNIQPLAEDIKRVVEQNKILQAEGKKTTSALRQVGASLFGWNTLLLVGVSLLTAYGPKLVQWVQGLNDGGAAARFAKQELEDLNKATQESNKQAGDQIGRLRVLNGVLSSNTSSAKEKKEAYREIIEQYPEHAAQLQDEFNKTGNLANIINTKLVPAIIAAAKARAYEKRIQDLSNKEIDLAEKQAAQIREVAKARRELSKESGIDPRAFAAVGVGGYAAFGASEADKAREGYNTIRETAIDTQVELNRTTNKIKEYSAAIVTLVGSGTKVTKDFKDGSTGAAESTNKLTKSVKDLNNELRVSQTVVEDFNIYDQLKQFRDAPTIDPQFQELKASLFPDLSKEIQANANKMGEATKNYTNAVSGNIQKGKDQVKDEIASFNNLLQTALTNGIGTFAEGIGNALSGIENPFDSFLGFLGSAIKEFGKYLIQVGVMSEAFKNATKSLGLTGLPAIAAGTAAVILGQVLQSQAQKKQRSTFSKFADGGLVSGPTLGLVGEYAGAANNPEFIAPMDKAKAMFKEVAGGGEVRVYGRLDGRDILLSGERTKQYLNR